MPLKNVLCLFGLTMPLLASDPCLEALMKAGHFKRLRVQVDSRVRNKPNDPETSLWQARVKAAFGNIEGAYTFAKKAAESGSSAEAWADYAQFAGLMAQKAGLLKKYGYAKECHSAAEKAYGLDPKNEVALGVLYGYYEQAPSMIGGDKTKAAQIRQQLDVVSPSQPYQRKVWEAMQSRDAARIDIALQQAMKARNQDTDLFIMAAGYYLQDLKVGNIKAQEAEKAARHALDLDPQKGWAHIHLAGALVAQGRWKELDETLAKSEQTIPDNLGPHYQVARFLLENFQDPKRSEFHLRKFLSQEPEPGVWSHAEARWRLGQALERQGRKQEAIQEIQAALKLNPNLKDAKADLKRLG